MVDFGMEPQEALDAPRWRLDGVDSCVGPASVNDVTCVLKLHWPFAESGSWQMTVDIKIAEGKQSL